MTVLSFGHGPIGPQPNDRTGYVDSSVRNERL